MSFRFPLSLLLLLAASFAHLAPLLAADEVAEPVTIPLAPGSVVELASVAQGQKLLAIDDDFSRRLTTFDIASRVRGVEKPTKADWQSQLVAEVIAWDAETTARLRTILGSMEKRLARFDLALPATIYLVQTTGREESHAAYTRGDAIMLPVRLVRGDDRSLETLLLHELFHVLSRKNAALRRAMYRIVGFEEIAEIELPESIADAKITNPDAPRLDVVISMAVDGQLVHAVPLLLAEPHVFDPSAGKGMFAYMKFKLVEVEGLLDAQAKLMWRVKMQEDEPVTISITPNFEPYFRKIGSNTRYIIHPEEVLADNFAYLVLERDDLPTPRVTDELGRLLLKP